MGVGRLDAFEIETRLKLKSDMLTAEPARLERALFVERYGTCHYQEVSRLVAGFGGSEGTATVLDGRVGACLSQARCGG